jgi:hypothetical protein
MGWLWLLLALTAAAQTVDYRELPPMWKTRALLGLIREGEPKAFEYAKEAYSASSQIDLSIEFKDYPAALKFFGPPEATLAEAWSAYQRLRDPKLHPAMPFPERPKSSPAKCSHAVVDNAKRYLRLAMDAGGDTFAAATLSLRSPVEIGDALELIPTWEDARAVPLGRELVQRLRRASSSRREFEAAKDIRAQVRRFEALAGEETREEIEETILYYESRNQAVAACGAEAASASEQDDFAELKYKVLRGGSNAATEFEFAEQFLRLYELAQGDEALLEELEQSGNARLRILVRAFRAANASPRR